MNTTTTDYGGWFSYTEGSTGAPAEVVAEVVGEWADDYDVDGLVRAYTDAINEALPEGVTLAGRMFFGPYPAPEGIGEQIREAIAGVSLTPLLERFERPEEPDRSPSAEQERAWDEQHDGTSLGA